MAPSSIGRWEFPMAPKSLVSHSGSLALQKTRSQKAKETCNHQGKSTEWHLSPIEIAKHRTRKKTAIHIVICGVLQKQQF
jgi:hypothetical protein